MKIKLHIFAALLIAALSVSAPALAEDTFLTLLTGGASGTYYRLGTALAKEISANSKLHITALRSAGSVENITSVSDGAADVAFAQNDTVHWAMNGTGAFASGAMTNIRAIASLYPEYVQIFTRAERKISGFAGLRGLRVGIGAVNSGVECDMRAITRVLDLSYGDMDVKFTDFGASVGGVRDGLLDVGTIVAGIPTPALNGLAASLPIRLISFSGSELDALTARHPYFEPAVIPAGMYGSAADIRTPAVRAMLITNADADEKVIYEFTKKLFESIAAVGSAHDAAASISPENAVLRLTAPLHPGAERFYREHGVIAD